MKMDITTTKQTPVTMGQSAPWNMVVNYDTYIHTRHLCLTVLRGARERWWSAPKSTASTVWKQMLVSTTRYSHALYQLYTEGGIMSRKIYSVSYVRTNTLIKACAFKFKGQSSNQTQVATLND